MKKIISVYLCLIINFVVCLRAEATISMLSASKTIAPNGDILYRGYDYELFLSHDGKILFNGKEITDLVHYIRYSKNGTSSTFDILRRIDEKDPQMLEKVKIFNNNPNSQEVVNALFYASADSASTSFLSKHFNRMKNLVQRGADVNFIAPEQYLRQNALGLNICKNSRVTEFLKKNGAKILDDTDSSILSRCLERDDVENLLYIAKYKNIDWNREHSREYGNLLNIALNKRLLDPKVIDIFLNKGAKINNEGFNGALVHGSSSDVIRKMLNSNRALATTPIIRKEEKSSFLSTKPKYVKVEIYPLTQVLDLDFKGKSVWKIWNLKKCQLNPSCTKSIKDTKNIVNLLLKHGAEPQTKKEKTLIKKILSDVI